MNKLLIFLLFAFLFCAGLDAQVTIGNNTQANKGALLDLKEYDKLDANSNRGMLLPRVLLDSLTVTGANTNLASTIKNASNTWNKEEHIGLMVYNVQKANACNGVPDNGLYVWNGDQWDDLWSDKPVRPKQAGGTDQYEGANTYILMKGQRVTIPIKRAFQIWSEYSSSPSKATGHVLPDPTVFFPGFPNGTLTVDIVWQESFDNTNSGVIDNNITINKTSPNDGSSFTVLAGNKEGNALIALKLGGKVIWQWQIWVPTDDPTSKAYSYNTGARVYWFMDRYLGAIDTNKQKWTGNGGGSGGAPTLRNSHGLYYQWGRPTPFKKFGEQNIDSREAIIGQEDQNLLAALQTADFIMSSDGSVAAGAPVKGNSSTEDWYSNTPQLWPDRWSNGKTTDPGIKTAFDPCPQGWRIPAWDGGLSPWNCLRNSLSLDVNSYSGYDFTQLGRILGYYPVAGYRPRSTGYLYDVGKLATIWTATPSTNASYGAHRLYFNDNIVGPPNKEINPESVHRFANALSVRCVQDN